MIKVEVTARLLRDAEWQAAHGNRQGALTLYRRLFKAGCADVETFGRYRRLHQAVHGSDLPHGEVFDFIYSANVWGANADATGTSGIGSAEAMTAPYRKFLTAFMKVQAVTSVVDVGCGDWQLGRLIDWTGIDYIGVDVSAVVMKNTRAFAAPNVQFVEGDARAMELPRADLILVKDVLQHWSNDDIKRFLPKLRGYRHGLITNGGNPVDTKEVNRDTLAGGYRLVDLASEPFRAEGSYVFYYDIVVPPFAGGPIREHKRVFLVKGGNG